jgi:phospholipid methyltransferase
LTPRARRAAARHVMEHHGLSERRATGLLAVDRSTMRYASKRPSDAPERALLKGLAAERRRFGYAASTIQVEERQPVVSTGPYAYVRHPMYSGALLLVAAMPLALGSWLGVFLIVPFLPILVWRILDEENFLERNLSGYAEYMRRVQYRLVPGVW